MEKTIVIEQTVQNILNITQGAGQQLFNDIDLIRTLDANGKEVTGKTTGGFNFRKLLNAIVIF